jgi:hypothetical protein
MDVDKLRQWTATVAERNRKDKDEGDRIEDLFEQLADAFGGLPTKAGLDAEFADAERQRHGGLMDDLYVLYMCVCKFTLEISPHPPTPGQIRTSLRGVAKFCSSGISRELARGVNTGV